MTRPVIAITAGEPAGIGPELVAMLDVPGRSRHDPRLVVYPDPPLATDELDVIRGLDRNLCPITPLMLLAS